MNGLTAALIAVQQNVELLRGVPGDPGKDGRHGKAAVAEPGMVWRGMWQVMNTYQPGDVVESNGSTYIATQVTGRKPAGEDWDLMAQRGADGPRYIPRSGGGAAGGVTSVNGASGVVVLGPTDLGLDTDLTTFAVPASTTISAFGASLVDDAAASDARTTLGLGTAAVAATGDFDAAGMAAAAQAASQPLDADLTAIAALTTTAFGRGLLDDANAAAVLTTLGLDADLATLALPASTTISAFGASLVDDAAASNARTTLGLGTIATQDANNVSISGGAVTGITDLAIADGGTAASTAAGARTNLGVVASTVGLNAGTSNPGGPTTNDLFFRTDLGMIFTYNGTRWLCVCPHEVVLGHQENLFPLLTSGNGGYGELDNATLDLWIVRIACQTTTLTTNNGTNFWTVAFTRQASGTSLGSFSTGTTPDTAGTGTRHDVTVGALAGTSDRFVAAGATKTLTPGGIYIFSTVLYNYVAP